jgi:hypothetical protein
VTPQGWLHEEVSGVTPQAAFSAYYHGKKMSATTSAAAPFWVDDLKWPENKNCSWHF